MPSRLIPLFPLQLVVFPRTNLPLHIFEERYKEMTGKVMRENSEFGIVLAKDEGIVNAGCTVKVEKLMHLYPDGRMDILTRGQKRFEISELNDEQTYLQAEVEFFDDDDPEPTPPNSARAPWPISRRSVNSAARASVKRIWTILSSAFSLPKPCPISTSSMRCFVIVPRRFA